MEETLTLVYIGPSIPYTNLRKSQILSGTQTQIDAFLGDLYEKYPEIKHMLVEVDNLAAAMKKVRSTGNILNKYYKDIEARAYVSRKGY